MVEAARIAYRDYPTVVNAIPESGLTYRNDIREYAKMDSALCRAQKAIGGSSDSAQLGQSFMWSKVAKGEFDEEYQQLYHNVVILAVLAQVAIDNVKRVYAVDPNDEIERIRSMACMKRKKDFPLFMKYTHKIPVTKNGKERPYAEIKKDREKIEKRIDYDLICPMNYLEKSLDRIQGANRGDIIDTASYFIKLKGRADHHQMSKIRVMIEDYDNFVKSRIMYIQDKPEVYEEILDRTNTITENLRKIKISAVTMNRLIETCMGVMGKARTDQQYTDAMKYMLRTFNILYRVNPDQFLRNFTKNKIS